MEKSQRVTVMLDEDLIKKLRAIQASQIKKSQNTVSFSKVINQFLEKGLK